MDKIASQAKIKLFFQIFTPIALVVLMLSSWAVFSDIRYGQEQLESRELARVKVAQRFLGQILNATVSDLRLLSSHRLLYRYLDLGGVSERQQLEDSLLTFAREKKIYDQIRYIDASGHEVVRVNIREGRAKLATHAELQNKADRYYFTETMKLSAREIYISRMDLNIEEGQIEIPKKPMIRVAMPVVDLSGEKRGMIILNYLAANLLDDFTGVMTGKDVVAMLLDADGYWLSGPDPEQEWGMMQEQGMRFGDRYPAVWQAISANDNDSLSTSDGLFIYGTVYPLGRLENSLNDTYQWVIVAHIPASKMPAATLAQYPFAAFLVLATLFATAMLSWLLAHASIRRRESSVRERELQAQLEHIGRISMIGELTASLAHEINSPLGNIATYAAVCIQRINEGKPAYTFEPLIRNIEQQVHLASDIINRARDLVGKDKPPTEVVDLNETVTETLGLLERQLKSSEATVTYVPDPGLPHVAIAKTQLQQILINLVMNAIDAIQDELAGKREILIKARADGAGLLEVTVADTGPALEVPAHLFDPFYTTKKHGLGLGLAICRTLVENEGGRIWASICDDHGLCVHFTLQPVT